MSLDDEEIKRIAAAAVPDAPSITSSIAVAGSIGAQLPNILVNHGVIVSGTVHGIVSKELTGQANLGPSASELMALIAKHGDAQPMNVIK
jgi:hypothetical protein